MTSLRITAKTTVGIKIETEITLTKKVSEIQAAYFSFVGAGGAIFSIEDARALAHAILIEIGDE